MLPQSVEPYLPDYTVCMMCNQVCNPRQFSSTHLTTGKGKGGIWGGCSTPLSAHFTPGQVTRRLGGLQGLSGQVRDTSSPPVFDLRTVQPVASPYTNCVIPAHVYIMTNVNICRTESLIMNDGRVSVTSLPTTFLAPVLNIWTIASVKKQLGDSFPVFQSPPLDLFLQTFILEK